MKFLFEAEHITLLTFIIALIIDIVSFLFVVLLSKKRKKKRNNKNRHLENSKIILQNNKCEMISHSLNNVEIQFEKSFLNENRKVGTSKESCEDTQQNIA